MNREYIADLEADDLIEKATKIHCLSLGWVNKEGNFVVKSTTDYKEMISILTNKETTLIGHNFYLYDVLIAEKILKIKVLCKIRDTLGISWYLQPVRNEHSVESYAIEYGEHKIEINDWKNLSSKEYVERCEKDVHLQYKIWINQLEHLDKLYDNDKKEIDRFLDYISFKLDCIKEQQNLGLKFNDKLAEKTLNKLLLEKENKIKILKEGMPKTPIIGVRKMPVRMYNSKSELSSFGKKWVDFLKEQNLPISHTADVEFIKNWEEPNPVSHVQIKKWLFDLGWKPEHYKFNRNKKTGEIKQVPQIGNKEKDGTLCPSVLSLVKFAPAIEELNGLSIINHRISVFEGMLRDCVNGRLYQNMAGFTNTMRLQHRVLVNLPKPIVPYGKEIRGCLVADKGYLLCGSDLSSLEDKTKQHYIYKYDPEYVKEMNIPGFDPHLDLAIRANMLTYEQAQEHKLYVSTKGKEGKDHTPVRHKAKTTNYAATYGAGAAKIAQAAEAPLSMGKLLHNSYWERNWAVKKTAENAIVKTIGDQMWIFNPISKFWYSLRYEKDKFSTLNQSTGVYVFDTWVGYCRQQGIEIAYQSHDEILFNSLIEEQELNINKIKKAIDKTNNLLKLNIEIQCDIKFGNSYKDVH